VTTTSTPDTGEVEDLDEFRQRARRFIRANLAPVDPRRIVRTLRNARSDDEELAAVARDREVQRMLFEAGLAGICFPKAYGGQGLTPAHQRVLEEELAGHEYPAHLQVPNFSPCAAVLLEMGTEEQRQRHLPAILRGEEIWMQLLSEPSGGSDVAAALTTAVRDGDAWILNGSKIWTTGAWWSDWGLCLARTNWDVPKHRGLTVFMLPIDREGVEVHRIEMLNGNREFCQEFLTDVVVPDSDRIGEVDEGWSVGVRWMFHERSYMSSPYVTTPIGAMAGDLAPDLISLARQVGRASDATAADLIGEARALELAHEALISRIATGLASGTMSEHAAAIGRLSAGTLSARRATIAFEVAGEGAVAWRDGEGSLADVGDDYLLRQTSSIGGGTTEMARNVIAERVLGMPREQAADRGIAFRDVPRGRSEHT
jgi:alkylation response protein AidB-like acyl-CoA dehydrogenase